MKVHPLAELIPPMSDEEYAELRDDIKANGLREPITLYEEKILDGRHRAKVCDELGVELLTRDYEGDEPVVFVISMNVHRRHLIPGQRAEIARRVLPELREDAKRRQGEHAATAERDEQGHVKPSSGPMSGSRTDSEAREQAGKLVGVSGRTVSEMDQVADKRPDLHKKVLTGAMGVREAWTQTKAPDDIEQKKPEKKQTKTYFGRGDKWIESTRPLTNYLAAWEKRNYEFSHLNPREAQKRVERIDNLIAGLEAARADLELRSHKAKLSL